VKDPFRKLERGKIQNDLYPPRTRKVGEKGWWEGDAEERKKKVKKMPGR